ncbi:MAG TPA: DinB family protein [Puia sp.]|nr:DinB family protein [Puia sp.]
MSNRKWFEREFDLSFGQDEYTAIYERLRTAPEKLRQVVAGLPEEVLLQKPDGKWSVKEHAGHLSVLEPLWRIRFQDIREGKPVLTTADLNNTATSNAGFNDYPVAALVEQFAKERSATLSLLNSIDVLDEEHTSLHPRLQQPMRIIDLAYFVAEHDEHHFAAMREMSR